ncbi:MAG: CoB--CoM heterodisulfide reductase iron-sulfur subunit A family protein [Candidatus Lokiarchaeota archaeon]|nr:CoB--CoM heterodisulfide reductase iron-sulfur subunit A family protein [Candidatus Lokiarchaeota archaeon]
MAAENAEKEIRIGCFVCRCGVNIAGTLDTEKLAEYSGKLPNVVHSTDNISLCTTSGADLIKEAVEEHKLNRIIVAACTPKTHQPVFRAVLEDSGLDPSYLEFVNIREHVSFVHMKEKDKAQLKAEELIRAGVARSMFLEPIPEKTFPVEKKALVIGGGIGGMQAALDLASEYEVYLVEKAATIGGKMAMLDRTFPTDDCSI